MKHFDQFKNKVFRIAEQRPSGFTFNPWLNSFPVKGYVVASYQTQDCFGKFGLFKVMKFVAKHMDYCIGGWRNENGDFQFDASKVYMNIEEAVEVALANNQRAIFNLYTGKEIMSCDYGRYTRLLAA